ncbi:ABC transporter ATP-binding protein [Roseibium sediminis]|uniref:ABC transporter ATP-binding protein n=1 Tax=Roseibium sediminis TaxID=1775174 RepID=UPI00123D8AFD|nr:ABC transporter ATP-binding protein [Roseibium sediminis]
MRSVFELFERWIDPFKAPVDPDLPRGGFAFLWYFVRQTRWPFVLMLVLGSLTAIVETAIFSFIGKIVDLLQGAEKSTFFSDHWHTLLFMGFVVLVVRAVNTSLTALVEEQTVVPGFFNLVRWQSHSRVMRQSLSYFHDDFAGRISQKVWQSGQAAGDFMVTLLQVAWFIIVYALTSLVLFLDLDWRLGALIGLWLVCFCAVARFYVPKVRGRAKDVAHAGSSVNGRLVDTYSNISTVKLFGSAETENAGVRVNYDTFLTRLKTFTRTLTSVRIVMSILGGMMMILTGGMALILWQGDVLTAGDVAFSLGIVVRMNLLLNRMMGQLNNLFRSMGTLQDSMDLIVRPIVLTDREDAKPLRVDEGRIDFRDIRFHYGKAGGVIDHLDLTVKPGERIGIVGPSGAGKTTLLNLLLRFYDPEAGQVLIDGVDIRTVTQESLRHYIGMVTQDVSLLHRSIRDNIIYGRPDAGEEELLAAATNAHAMEFISTLQDQRGRAGFDAHVGERGVKLSGGQRQRIAIARVLLKDAPILVLDEATSALDSEVEAAIQENLGRLMDGKTVIAVAHRLSTIASLDRLIVMNEGRIVQTGRHQDLLLDEGGLYAQLWARQSGGFLPDDLTD